MKITKQKLLLLLIMIVIGIGITYYLYGGTTESIQYRPYQVSEEPLEITVRASGTVSPMNRLEIKPPVAGRIETILIQEGQNVRKGQILAWMSSTERAALLDAARAKGPEEVKEWEDLYKPTPVMAPLSGLVIANFINPGQTVTQQDPLIVLSDYLIVRAQVDETDLAKIRVNQIATITIDSFQSEKIKAKVRHIAYEALIVNNVTVYEVEVAPESKSEIMRSGMSATIDFQVASKDKTIMVPFEAIKKNSQGFSYVNVASQNSKNSNWIPEERVITIGLSDETMIEIIDGLESNEIVLIEEKIKANNPQTKSSNPLTPTRIPKR
ncbi:efflux RND transporter periplasmic adaptor subunit [Leptospira sp. GIMC2001]|uniref:efflux RND transporter periplasmic adaptor subunit n=1 Tax=Leptospira sp. GIMC2001 TaxID=1513297 RepID=UPI00234A0223|nr:HlyD family efflux transporter periplasmic adaptor subunit [Leptospira sp. GIMC2001]WCL49014.1 efflux RND transporter periplasmic adaptor subunit [Leptospira sp. GIMC2001]